MWTKESALAEIRALADAASGLSDEKPFGESHTRWVARTLSVLEEIFGRNSRYYKTFADYSWQKVGSLLVGGPGDRQGARNLQAAIERRHHEAYVLDLESARGLLLAAADHLERSDLQRVYEGKDTGPESSAIVRVINLASQKLRKVMRSRPSTEAEVQDAYESLLIGADVPYSRGSRRIEYSSKTYVPDFTVDRIDLAIEIKFCNRDDREKEIIAEINDDILAYRTEFGNLLFVVYDLGFIRDIDRFKGALEEHNDVVVEVVKH